MSVGGALLQVAPTASNNVTIISSLNAVHLATGKARPFSIYWITFPADLENWDFTRHHRKIIHFWPHEKSPRK